MFRLLVALVALLAAGHVGAAQINVYAASSLTDALKEIRAKYEAQSGDRILYNFAASNMLARQIDEGAPADIFFSADDAQMDRLEKSGRTQPESRRDLLSNSLVVVAAAESKLALAAPGDLRGVSRIAVGDPKFVPVGVYARAFLEKAGLWADLQGKIVPTENVRAGLAVVESGNADVAFVYATDAAISKKVKVALRIPPDETPPITYPAALMARHKPEAAKFLDYLAANEAREVFERFGFIAAR